MEILLIYYICVFVAILLMVILGTLTFNKLSDILEFGIEKIIGIIWLILFIPPLAIIIATTGIVIYFINK